MQIRNVPYGYKFENGKIVVNTQESKSVIEIFEAYKSGSSLLNISNMLNEQNVEYMPGLCGWNKARLKRIIEDRRYLGDKKFPKVIDEEIFEQSSILKSNKNTQKQIDRQSNIFKLNVPVCCPVCKSKMRRQCDSRNIHRERWICCNSVCKTVFIKTDDELIKEINDLLNSLINNYEIIKVDESKDLVTHENLNNTADKINNMFPSSNIDKETLRNNFYTYASECYNQINSDIIKSQRLQNIFKTRTPTETFCKELFDKTVKRIFFNIKGNVGLKLINNQEISNEF